MPKNSTQSFQEKSYESHTKHFDKYSSGGKEEKHAKTWFEKDTVDAWRHQRMYHILDPILKVQSSRWLTVGDGRYGKDAKYIIDNGCKALATDISDALLQEAKNLGFVNDIKKENSESLSFNDLEFDYVFCKESYHHFPRPMLALYEMLRVAEKGVILIEPTDRYINDSVTDVLFRNLINLTKRLLGKKASKHDFEDSGNYVFRISRREIEKVSLGLNYKIVAFKGINDAYLKGVEFEKLSEKGPLLKKVRAIIFIRDLLCKLGLMNYQLLASIIFKKKPSNSLMQDLQKAGYEIINLPENPYIKE